MTRTVFAEWESYLLLVVPDGAPPVQVEETRRAFYAGAWAFYVLLMEAAGDNDTEEQAQAKLLALRTEILSILRDMSLAQLVAKKH